jgi:hypothetical protein
MIRAVKNISRILSFHVAKFQLRYIQLVVTSFAASMVMPAMAAWSGAPAKIAIIPIIENHPATVANARAVRRVNNANIIKYLASNQTLEF